MFKPAAHTPRAVGWQERCLEMRGKTCPIKDPEAFVIKKRQKKDKGDPQNDGLLWEIKSHGNNSRMLYEICRGLVSWPNVQLFLEPRSINYINWFWGNNTSGFCCLARLAVIGDFLPAVFNLINGVCLRCFTHKHPRKFSLAVNKSEKHQHVGFCPVNRDRFGS